MSTPVIAFFNNKGGVGKTSLVYHLAWMYAERGRTVLAADLDPQANLTTACLDEDRLETLWPVDVPHSETIFGAIEPLKKGVGDVLERPHVEEVDARLHLLVGDLALSMFEDELSAQWPKCLDGDERAFRVVSALWRVIQASARAVRADLALVDLGPNLGAINRAALISADYLVVPLAPDLFSLQGLKNLGPTLKGWREGWKERLPKRPASAFEVPKGTIQPIGYVVLQHAVRLKRPVKAYERWVKQIPGAYARSVAARSSRVSADFEKDPACLGLVKHYRSLMPLAQEARRPMFLLRPGDGAIGAHQTAVGDARRDFEALADRILERCRL